MPVSPINVDTFAFSHHFQTGVFRSISVSISRVKLSGRREPFVPQKLWIRNGPWFHLTLIDTGELFFCKSGSGISTKRFNFEAILHFLCALAPYKLQVAPGSMLNSVNRGHFSIKGSPWIITSYFHPWSIWMPPTLILLPQIAIWLFFSFTRKNRSKRGKKVPYGRTKLHLQRCCFMHMELTVYKRHYSKSTILKHLRMFVQSHWILPVWYETI